MSISAYLLLNTVTSIVFSACIFSHKLMCILYVYSYTRFLVIKVLNLLERQYLS